MLQELGAPRVAVVGDFMLDRYVWGDAGRVSPEAPVPVVHAQREDHRLGGAGNVVANIAGLGGRALCFGLLGEDEVANEMIEGLRVLGADVDGLVQDGARPTIQKIRIMARNHQMLRVDREQAAPIPVASADRLLKALREAEWDALVLSDYGKGTLSPEVIQAALAEARHRDVPSVVDPKHRDLSRYRGASVVTPNRAEAEVAAGESLRDLEALQRHGEEMRAAAGLDALLITLGPEGMYLLDEGEPGIRLPTAARQVYDVTGAGDTVVAMLAVARGGRLGLEQAVRLANAAAGLAVAKVGTTAVGRQELLHELRAAAGMDRVVPAGDFDALQIALTGFRNEGRRVVFTNGCFDILHAGHVRYLREAARLGGALVVGLNSDASVLRMKGPERPINPIEDRAEVLAGLACVDLVAVFEHDTPEELIRAVCPEVLVKGSDWKDKGVVGAEFVEAQGGEVKLIELVPGRSTTAIVSRIKERGAL
ncbi:MAG: D-glycero-beta-D-manno-heptose-7-phosphate kinase [Planctomycetes bacterium]|nr:D-glycero-beta-D-manno-heptose-7-phosphate kinase [Planctomycetota bacterium]